jgi:hypothetical protein
MSDEELLLHQLKNPPVMSMALNKDHLYRMMADRMKEAADRIEQLVAINEALTAERDEARVAINQIGKCIGVLGAVQCVGDIVVEAEKRFSRLAKAVEAADRMLDAFCIHETQQQVEAYDSMCATLAEIEGEKG